MQLPFRLLLLHDVWTALFNFIQSIEHESPSRLVWPPVLHSACRLIFFGLLLRFLLLLFLECFLNLLSPQLLLVARLDLNLESSYFLVHVDELLASLLIFLHQVLCHLFPVLGLLPAGLEFRHQLFVVVHLCDELIFGLFLLDLHLVESLVSLREALLNVGHLA